MRRAILLVLLIPGCVRVPRLPDGYVPIERGEHDWRAISAHGVVIGLRSFDHDPAGTLDFWSTVVEKELASTRGYVLEASEAATAAGGLAGRLLVFAAPGSESRTYLVAVFLTATRIVVFETGGPRGDVEKGLPVLRAFIASMKLS